MKKGIPKRYRIETIITIVYSVILIFFAFYSQFAEIKESSITFNVFFIGSGFLWCGILFFFKRFLNTILYYKKANFLLNILFFFICSERLLTAIYTLSNYDLGNKKELLSSLAGFGFLFLAISFLANIVICILLGNHIRKIDVIQKKLFRILGLIFIIYGIICLEIFVFEDRFFQFLIKALLSFLIGLIFINVFSFNLSEIDTIQKQENERKHPKSKQIRYSLRSIKLTKLLGQIPTYYYILTYLFSIFLFATIYSILPRYSFLTTTSKYEQSNKNSMYNELALSLKDDIIRKQKEHYPNGIIIDTDYYLPIGNFTLFSGNISLEDYPNSFSFSVSYNPIDISNDKLQEKIDSLNQLFLDGQRKYENILDKLKTHKENEENFKFSKVYKNNINVYLPGIIQRVSDFPKEGNKNEWGFNSLQLHTNLDSIYVINSYNEKGTIEKKISLKPFFPQLKEKYFTKRIEISRRSLELIEGIGNAQLGFSNNFKGNWFRMLYFSSGLATSTVFGDVVPITFSARLLVIFQSLTSIIIISLFFNAIGYDIIFYLSKVKEISNEPNTDK